MKKKAWSAAVLNLTAKLNIVNAIEVAKLVAKSAAVGNARIKNLGKIYNLIIQLDVNVRNQDAPKNIVNAFKMEKNVELNANAQTVAIQNEEWFSKSVWSIFIDFNKSFYLRLEFLPLCFIT